MRVPPAVLPLVAATADTLGTEPEAAALGAAAAAAPASATARRAAATVLGMTNPFRPARAGFEQDDRPPGPERDRPGRDDGAVTESPFRQAVEAQDADRLTAALHPDVV